MSNLDSSLTTLFSKMESFVTSKTVVGEPLEVGGIVILPLVDITVGVGAGSGGEAPKSGGGGGLGAKITPSAVIVIQDGTAQMINIKNQDSINKLIDMVPGVLGKLNFGPFKKNVEEPVVTEVRFSEDIEIQTSEGEV